VPITDHFDAIHSLSKEDFENLSEWGINVLRLGVEWPGIEPQQGVWNETVLDILQGIVVNASAYGIDILVDMHQDCLAQLLCGEGIPSWAVRTRAKARAFPEPLHAAYVIDNTTGLPRPEDCALLSWASYQVCVVGVRGESRRVLCMMTTAMRAMRTMC
jgi:endoglycosylceramidase